MDNTPWKKWGPYLSERQWGTVREDYSADGDAWKYFTHDHARSRAYHGAKTGWRDAPTPAAALSACWRLERTRPILKERSFGLDNEQGNHGEDVKELLLLPRLLRRPTPTSKYLYKYPQPAFPYADLVERTAGARGTSPSTSCSTPASSTTTATSTSSSNTPRPDPKIC